MSEHTARINVGAAGNLGAGYTMFISGWPRRAKGQLINRLVF
jgi:hypothetical protein